MPSKNLIKFYHVLHLQNSAYTVKWLVKFIINYLEPFKAYVKKQDTYCLRCKKELIINQFEQNKW